MNLFDFLYACLKEGLFSSVVLPFFAIFIAVLIVPMWPFLFYIAGRIKYTQINKQGIIIDSRATEKGRGKGLFSNLFKKKQPAVLNKKDNHLKEMWCFSKPAYYLGIGKDNRHYFIGYFGNGIPSQFRQINVDCETIVGADWDNTPLWNSAYKKAKELYGFCGNDAPSYNGNGVRSGRNLYGIYACNTDISENFK